MCQVECDSATVSLYIWFLAQTWPAAQRDLQDPATALEDLAVLAQKMVTVIVERSGLLPAILPGSSHPAATPPAVQHQTYEALLRVFTDYMALVRRSAGRLLGWSDSQDLINVRWASEEGEEEQDEESGATLHILVVHAQIILLTYGSPTNNSDLFNNLLGVWFPPGRALPRAFLADTFEEALLIQDWLKLKV